MFFVKGMGGECYGSDGQVGRGPGEVCARRASREKAARHGLRKAPLPILGFGRGDRQTGLVSDGIYCTRVFSHADTSLFRTGDIGSNP